MGNTNLPQAGAANLPNGRDTLSGDEQLTEAERWERDHAGKSRGTRSAPSHEERAPTSGQRKRDAGAAATSGNTANQPHKAAEPSADDPYDPHNSASAANPPAVLPSHVDTGHSPSDAT